MITTTIQNPEAERQLKAELDRVRDSLGRAAAGVREAKSFAAEIHHRPEEPSRGMAH
jgi:hypothetical protein